MKNLAALLVSLLVIFVGIFSYLIMTDLCGVLAGTFLIALCIFAETLMNMKLTRQKVENSLIWLSLHATCAIIVFACAFISGKINGFWYVEELGHGNHCQQYVAAWHWLVLAGVFAARVIWQIVFLLIYFRRKK